MNLIQAFQRMRACRTLAPFYRQWAVLEGSGMPLADSLDTLASSASPAEEERLACLRDAVARGSMVLDGMSLGFTEVEVAFINTGVTSGNLDRCLLALADLFETDWRAVQQVVRKMTYPLFVAFAACWVPTLPMAFFVGPWAWVCTGLIGTLMLFVFGGYGVVWYFKYLRGKPKYAQARFLAAMATALDAGIDYEASVALASHAAAPSPLALQLKYLKPQGRPFAEVLSVMGVFDEATISMIETGEQSGTLPMSLRAAARYMENGTI